MTEPSKEIVEAACEASLSDLVHGFIECIRRDDARIIVDGELWSRSVSPALTKEVARLLSAALASRSPAPAERVAELEGRIEEMKSEQKLFDEDLGEKQRIIDRIADLIGLSKDRELEQLDFELWFTKNRQSAAPADRAEIVPAVLALLDDYATNPATAANVAAMAETIAIKVRALASEARQVTPHHSTDKT